MQIIVVLGGGLVKDAQGWRTTRFDEGDEFGVLGDFLRVYAGAALYADAARKHCEALVVVCGGRGHLAPGAPTIASVIKNELLILGVHAKYIRVEERSGTTLEQLVELQKMVRAEGWDEITIISNKYHLPRVRALIQYVKPLIFLRHLLKNGMLVTASAEEILIARDETKWKDLSESAYASKRTQERILLEQKGVEDIKVGIYNFSS